MAKLTVHFEAVTSKLSGAITRMESRFDAFKKRASAALGVLSGAAGMIGGALALNGIKSMITDLDNLGKTARNLGVTGEELQKLQYAANSVNLPADALEPALNAMRKLIGDAENGLPKAARKINLVGVAMADLRGKTTTEQLGIFADAILGIQDPTERSTAAMNVFGASGAKMLNFLAEYRSAGDRLADRGAIVSDKEIQAAEDFNQALTDISALLKSLALNSGLLTQLKSAAELLRFVQDGGLPGAEKKAAKSGAYTRRTGTDYAIAQAEKSGQYTPAEIKKMKGIAELYGGSTPTVGTGDGAALIDRALKDSGLGKLARTNPDKWFGNQFAGSAEIVVLAPTKKEVLAAKSKREESQKKVADDRAAEEKRRRETREEAARAAAEKAAAAEAEKKKKEEEAKKKALDRATTETARTQSREIEYKTLENAGRGREAAQLKAEHGLQDKFAGIGETLPSALLATVRENAGRMYDMDRAGELLKKGPAARDADLRTYETDDLRRIGGNLGGMADTGMQTIQNRLGTMNQALAEVKQAINSINLKTPSLTDNTGVSGDWTF